MTRLYKSVLLGCGLFWLAGGTLPAEVEIELATDLQAEAREARERRLPILLNFSARFCDYCRQLDDEFLRPMLISGEYSDRILIRQVLLDNGSRVADLAGERIATRALADRYRVFVTPTILFLDWSGREIAQRMTGINTPEMFGGYLDNCIDTALYAIRAPHRLARMPGCRLQQDTELNPAGP